MNLKRLIRLLPDLGLKHRHDADAATYGAEVIARINAAFDADQDTFIETSTVEPTKADFLFIGRVVQLYCYADFCARRVIDVLREAAIGPEARNGSVLQEAQVFPKLREAADMLWDGNLKETLLRAANTIEMHRDHRHYFAHCAVRRVKGERAFMLLSKNGREFEKRDGRARDAYELTYGILPLHGFEREMEKLDQHTHNLSVAAYRLEHSLDELRREFATRGLHQQRGRKARRAVDK